MTAPHEDVMTTRLTLGLVFCEIPDNTILINRIDVPILPCALQHADCSLNGGVKHICGSRFKESGSSK